MNQVLSYEKFLGGGIPESFVPEEIREIFQAGGQDVYKRQVVYCVS